MIKQVTVGVLALQGAFREHCEALEKVGAIVVEVRLPEHLEELDGLVIPGGESTAIMLIAERWGLVEPLKAFIQSGKPVWGTCAGLILLSNKASGTKQQGQKLLGGLDVHVHRNYFGSQLGSFEAPLEAQVLEKYGETPYNAVFIRAPAVLESGPEVKVLSTIAHVSSSKSSVGHGEKVVVAVRQANLLGTSFHPELTDDVRWHRYFVEEMVAVLKN